MAATEPIKAGEKERIGTLESYGIAGTAPEKAYDDIAALAAVITKAPFAYITFIDTEQLWFKSTRGFSSDSMERQDSYCQHVLRLGKPLMIPDTAQSDLVEPVSLDDKGPIRAYCGVPLRVSDGSILGTLCIADYTPRELSPDQLQAVERLADQVVAQLELRRANKLLQSEREIFETLFEAAPVALVLVEEERIVRGNTALARLLGCDDSSAVTGNPITRFLSPFPKEASLPADTVLRDRSGAEIPVELVQTTLEMRGKSHQLLALTDIRDRKEKEAMLSEQRLQAENANRIKDTFLSLVSHDLKSPLSGIFTMLDLLASSPDYFTEEDRTSVIRDLRSTAALLVEMINQLLNIHRIKSGQIPLDKADTPIRPLVEEVALILNKQIRDKEIDLRIEIDRDFFMKVDAGLFREALFNLISNAVKFSPPRGIVRVDEAPGEIRVTDKGAGIPRKDLPDIFRHEVKTSRPGTQGEEGTGLGLPLVRDILRAHGGDVTVRSTGREGTCMVLLVPENIRDEDVAGEISDLLE
ncbi:PAS domain-containing protein [Alkalispirochaeta americana]|uniref:histidine kinase n=1 Tax=Alkalispirochaeta americana TaxID=159291 RepID=A0A1N6YBI0_9SPIO|nr:ATP-binding protein [Alkalispirochaeta americana]SIR11934.1 PAS domain-containing protein [Alkalispirochaeta americana]